MKQSFSGLPDEAKQPEYSSSGRHRSRAYHEKRRRVRLLRQLGLAALPFVLVVIGLVLISIGFFRYVENESMLALFLLNRDSAALQMSRLNAGQLLDDSEDEALPPLESHVVAQHAADSQERLKVPFYYIGQQFATLRIPDIELDLPVFQGDREREFRRGVGHFPGSFFPGQKGNILLAAHRTSYFRSFEYIEIGNLVYLDTTYGQFTYEVVDLLITEGDDQGIAADTPQEQLTMYTCYPFVYFGNAPQRFVVICDLRESELNQG